MMNPKVKIGLHWIPTHHRHEDRANFWGTPAPWQKVVYSGAPDHNHLKDLLANTTCQIIVRNHSKSEDKQAIWDNPEATGKRHAQEWAREIDGIDWSRLAVEGINEFPIWNPGGGLAQLRYELVFGEEGVRLGLPTVHAEFAVGWPGNGGIDDAPPNWEPWIPLLQFIRDTPDRYLGLHEYWGFNKGVMFYEGWWFLRYRKMPIKVPTVLTELGGLKAYQNEDGKWGLLAADGWMGDITTQEYYIQWREAELELRKDNHLLGATIFTTDGGQPWIGQCDAGPVNKYFCSWGQEQPDLKPAAEPEPGLTIHTYLPTISAVKDFQNVQGATEHTIDPQMLEAITRVESGSTGFGLYNRLKIRIEAHLLLDPHFGDRDKFQEYFKAGENYQGFIKAHDSGEWIEYHSMGQAGEWRAFEIATLVNPRLAMLNSSMGAAQIMGFNHERIGYKTIEEMWDAFNRAESNHIIGLLNYVMSDPNLVKAIQDKDWPTIGRLYNGAESAGKKYAAAYSAIRG